MKRIIILFVVIVMLAPSAVFAQMSSPQVYIALGDSLAAGQTPNREIDTGYTDLIAQRLKSKGQLGFYTKQLAFPGYTVDNVLEGVRSDEAAKLLSSATLITISAGANDLLSLVQANANAGTLSFSQLSVDYVLNNVRKKMQTLLAELDERAPMADVYVVGYYFAYPYVHDAQKEGTKKQLELLNAILKQEAELAGATYVSVYEDFGLEGKEYLPKSSDVHPNMEGYRVMANAFLQEYTGNNSWAISTAEIPPPNPLTFEQLLEMQKELDKVSEELEVKAKEGVARVEPNFTLSYSDELVLTKKV